MLLASLSVYSQEIDSDYRPFIEEGKVWVSRPEMYLMDINKSFAPIYNGTIVEYNYFRGDTVVGKRTCKRWIDDFRTLDGEKLLSFVTPMYEEDKKVWFFLEGHDTPFLAYDFGAKVGDTISVVQPSTYYHTLNKKTNQEDLFFEWYSDSLIVTSKEFKTIRGIHGKGCTVTYFLSIRNIYAEYSKICQHRNYHLYGIGSHYCPYFCTSYAGQGNGYHWLAYCVVGDEVLYADDEFANHCGIIKPTPATHPEMFNSNTNCITPTQMVWSAQGDASHLKNGKWSICNGQYFDLTGRRLAAPPAKGMYIENGRLKINK